MPSTNNPYNPPQTSEPVLSTGNDGGLLNSFGFSWYQWLAKVARVLFAPVSGSAPGTSASAGVPGQIAYDQNFLYVCTSSNHWKRIALTAF